MSPRGCVFCGKDGDLDKDEVLDQSRPDVDHGQLAMAQRQFDFVY